MDEGEVITLDTSTFYIEGHPQRESHQSVFLPENETRERVPNFMGGALPRRDKGDPEYYGATMLTLFKPWRSGQDLKTKDENWSEAFRKYNFDEKASRLMGNFNLRYECSDARDDFAAQRRSQGDKSGYSLPLSDDTLDSLDEDHTGHLMHDHNEEENEDEDEIQQLSVIGEKAAHKLHEMNAMENLLQTIGWTQTLHKSQYRKSL